MGEVLGDYGYIGGLIGYSSGTVSSCYGRANVLGLGDNAVDVAGLVGLNFGNVLNCYATGSASGSGCIGGLVGTNGGTISDCYATGNVSGGTHIGGLVGYNYSGSALACFWDIEKSGLLESDGGEGKTTAQMQTISTFTDAGWDFIEIWDIGEKQTYPFLRRNPIGDLNHSGYVDMFDFAILASHWLEGTGQ
jgi:hypothetical protein